MRSRESNSAFNIDVLTQDLKLFKGGIYCLPNECEGLEDNQVWRNFQGIK